MQSPTRIRLPRPLTTAILKKESSSSGLSVDKAIPIVISLSGIIYGVGLFVSNLGFYLMGFQDFSIPHQQCIETGIGFVFFCALAMAPSIVYRFLEAGNANLRRIRHLGSALVCLFLFLLLTAFWAHESKNPSDVLWAFRKVNQPIGTIVILLGIFSLGIGSWLDSSLFDLPTEVGRIAPFSQGKRVKLAIGLLIGALLILLLFSFTILMFYQLPTGLGGSWQQHKDLWFSTDAFQILSENGLLPKGTALDKNKPQLLKVSDVQVLHEGVDSTVMCKGTGTNNSCDTKIQVPSAWVKAQAWTTPVQQSNRKNSRVER